MSENDLNSNKNLDENYILKLIDEAETGTHIFANINF